MCYFARRTRKRKAPLHEISHGIRLFCAPDKVAQMMVELAALAGEHH